jgi:hypothetical protein
VINEILAAPGEDINQDGAITPADEFVEIYHTGDQPTDVSGYTLHDASNSGIRFRFPDQTVLDPGESYLIFAGMGDDGQAQPACEHAVSNGFLGLNDDQPETVTLRDPDGRVVAQAAFDDAPDGESLVLSPDGNLAGGYRPHSTVVAGSTSSPCVQPQAVLPLTLLSFTGRAMVRSIRLDWSTADELNHDRFIVERSKDGVDYTAIGEVESGPGTYAFVDTNPFFGYNMYRLRQRDFDGREEIFGPLTVRMDSGYISLYPNPTSGRLHLRGDVSPTDRVAIYGADGQRVAESLGPDLHLGHLPAGVYYLQLQRGSSTSSWRFIKE